MHAYGFITFMRGTQVSPVLKTTMCDNSSLWHTSLIKDTPTIRAFLFQEATSASFPACGPNFASTTSTILTTSEHSAGKGELLFIISITAYHLPSLILTAMSGITQSLHETP